jgi:aminoglycoside phosphotransferase (APT) family kinase protein
MLDCIAQWTAAGGDAEADAERGALLARLGGSHADSDPRLVADFDDSGDLGRILDSRMTETGGAAGAVREIAGIEHRFLQRESAAIASSVSAAEAMLAEIEVELTTERLDAYFASSDHFSGRRTRSIKRIPGGYSKDTYLVLTDGGDPSELIIRRDFPFGPTGRSAADEYGLLERLADTGLPVARPIAAEYDRSFVGEPFIVVEKMPGANAAELFLKDPALARSGCLELARLLGRLHAIDPDRLCDLSSDLRDPAKAVQTHLADWREHWLRHRIHPAPLAQAAFHWLAENTPQDIPRLVLVHADARPDNMLIENGRVSALLDWEFAHVGDPMEDLEYSRLYVEHHLDWADFIEAYLSAGGAPVSAAGTRFYEVWRSLRNFICCDVSWGGFVTDRYPSIKLSAQGVIYRRYFLQTLAQALERVA